MRLYKRVNAQAAFALMLIFLATVYVSQIPKLGMPFADGREPGASFFPILLTIVLYVAAIRTLFEELRRTEPEAQSPILISEHVPRVSVVGPVLLILLTVVFVFALPRLGYFVAAGFYTFGVALFFNYEETGRIPRAVVQSAITAAVITAFGWLFFEGLFDLSLPGWEM